MKKPQSGKSRFTTIVSFRLDNTKHKAIAKLCGGKKKVNSFIKNKTEELV